MLIWMHYIHTMNSAITSDIWIDINWKSSLLLVQFLLYSIHNMMVSGGNVVENGSFEQSLKEVFKAVSLEFIEYAAFYQV